MPEYSYALDQAELTWDAARARSWPLWPPGRWLISAISAAECGSCTPVRSTPGVERALFDVVFIRNLRYTTGRPPARSSATPVARCDPAATCSAPSPTSPDCASPRGLRLSRNWSSAGSR